MSAATPDTASPCTGLCRLDDDTRWCLGCGRSLDEIGRWSYAADDEKITIKAKLADRLAELGRTAGSQ